MSVRTPPCWTVAAAADGLRRCCWAFAAPAAAVRDCRLE